MMLTILELAVLVTPMIASGIYTFCRILIGEDISYPSIFKSNSGLDFIEKNLGELEMIFTVMSAAVTIFVLSALELAYSGYDLDPLLPVLATFILIQAVLPISKQTKNYEKHAKWTEIISFLIMPFVAIILSFVTYLNEERDDFVAIIAYTTSI